VQSNSKFGLAQYISSTGSLGIFDIDGDYKIKFVVTGAGPSNTFEVLGRIQGQTDFVLIDTVVSNVTKSIKVDEYDFLEIVCTVFDAVQTRVQIAGSGFGNEGGLNTITTPNGQIFGVADLIFTSSDSTVVISGIAPNTVDLKSTAVGGASNIDKFTLSAGNILSKSVTLSASPTVPAEVLLSVGGVDQEIGIDFSISGTLLSWSGMGLDGILTEGDIITVTYN
jgi:hypothetical protein